MWRASWSVAALLCVRASTAVFGASLDTRANATEPRANPTAPDSWREAAKGESRQSSAAPLSRPPSLPTPVPRLAAAQSLEAASLQSADLSRKEPSEPTQSLMGEPKHIRSIKPNQTGSVAMAYPQSPSPPGPTPNLAAKPVRTHETSKWSQATNPFLQHLASPSLEARVRAKALALGIDIDPPDEEDISALGSPEAALTEYAEHEDPDEGSFDGNFLFLDEDDYIFWALVSALAVAGCLLAVRLYTVTLPGEEQLLGEPMRPSAAKAGLALDDEILRRRLFE